MSQPLVAANTLGDFWEFVSTGDNWRGSQGIGNRTRLHLEVSLYAVAATIALAIPPALLLARRRRGGQWVVALANVSRALPTFAILVIGFSLFARYGEALSMWPTFVALTILGIPPVFTNTYTGIQGVDPTLVDAARGMGFREGQITWQVEVPVALPLIMAGVRTAAVQIVATATLGAFVGYNGLGRYIGEAIARGQSANDRMLTGVIGVAVLSILTELTFGAITKRLTPWRRQRA